MRHPWIFLALAGLLSATQGIAGHTRGNWWGVEWGYARTYWSSDKNDEGFPEAGTAAPLIGIRHVRPWKNLDIVPFAQLEWMHATTSYLICDTCYGELYTFRTQHREIDAGVHLHWFPNVGCGSVYFGGGPAVRLAHAGRQELEDRQPDQSADKTWIGLTLLGGWRTWYGKRFSAFFEPQLTYSPGSRDEGKYNPPTTLSMHMGFYWK